ncbi:isochorismatase family protein [Altererythrobacter lauratis]|mgnify:CR=1 FL=1|uniref:Isochorismatase family protein n=1 Tax=Alteraurantiacibacter lauratis TaxID=2054627 RepID=A0ABV7EG78_9SPHN
MSNQEEIYDQAGFGRPVPRGHRPAVIVVDFSYGFTDTQYPTAADMSDEISNTRKITDLARAMGFPVIYTTIAYQAAELDRLAWLRKSEGMKALLQGSRLVEIDARTGISPQDSIVVKKGASAFFGTNLAAFLASAQVDTVIIAGATTSGCVRASAVDAVQAGFNVLVPRDCVADRARAPHDHNLYDIQQKYGDVTDCDDLLQWLACLDAGC